MIRGTSTVEFEPEEEPTETEERPEEEVREIPWPTYGYDVARTRAVDFPHRPPFRLRWKIFTGANIEFPPVVAHGRLYVANQGGRFMALDADTGKRVWLRNVDRCAAAGGTVQGNTIYQGFLRRHPCVRGDRGNANGILLAVDADTGRERWRFETGAIESSPALVDGVLYFGTWDQKVIALDIRTRKALWTFRTDGEVHAAPAVARGTVFIGTTGGTLYAIDARTGRLRWQRDDGREFFYAGPSVAYGRVYIPNTDGTLYAYGARTGNLLWARTLGTYIYTSPAIADERVFVGTYDGRFFAVSAATGDPLWSFTAAAAIHGAPVVMNGLVYFGTCPGCATSEAQRFVKPGDRMSYALNAGNGREVWRKRGIAAYSPVVADGRRVYLLGAAHIEALEPRRRP